MITDNDTFRSYPSKIEEIYNNWPKVTQEGSNITLTPTRKGKMALEYKGNTIQRHLPTPDAPIDIEVATGTQTIAINTDSYPLNLGTLELCKIQNYQDRIYKDNGNWYLEKNIGKAVLDGSESWVLENNGTFGTRNSYFYDRKLFSTSFEGLLCNYYKVAGSGDYYIRWRGSNEYNVDINNKDISTVADFKTWLSTHNTAVYYVLATPTTTEITDTELINQLNAFWNAKSKQGQTNIIVEGDLPVIISATALMKGGN